LAADGLGISNTNLKSGGGDTIFRQSHGVVTAATDNVLLLGSKPKMNYLVTRSCPRFACDGIGRLNLALAAKGIRERIQPQRSAPTGRASPWGQGLLDGGRIESWVSVVTSALENREPLRPDVPTRLELSPPESRLEVFVGLMFISSVSDCFKRLLTKWPIRRRCRVMGICSVDGRDVPGPAVGPAANCLSRSRSALELALLACLQQRVVVLKHPPGSVLRCVSFLFGRC